VDRHVDRGYGAQPAIIHDSPVTGTVRSISYDQLLSEVCRFHSPSTRTCVTTPGPDLLNISRRSHDYLTIMPKLRSTYLQLAGMTYHLINKAVMKQNWIEALNQHAQPLKKKAALIIIVIIRIRRPTCAQVSQLASVLQCRGVVTGDRVLIYMPMIAEAIVTMLACARLGAVHSLVFGGFASKELATRINHAQVGPRRAATAR